MEIKDTIEESLVKNFHEVTTDGDVESEYKVKI